MTDTSLRYMEMLRLLPSVLRTGLRLLPMRALPLLRPCGA